MLDFGVFAFDLGVLPGELPCFFLQFLVCGAQFLLLALQFAGEGLH